MSLRLIILLLFSLVIYNAFGQQETYFYKIQDIASKEHHASQLYHRLDSLEKTRRPNDSYIELFFNREVDFGYKHQRINLEFNGTYYQVNLLVKNDMICLSSTKFQDFDTYYKGFNKRHSLAKIDSVETTKFLRLRNQFYNSSKSMKDLKNDLDLDEFYALRGGDGYNDTWAKLHLDTLVKQRNFNELKSMLQSISCEEQMYAVTGFNWLKKKNIKITKRDNEIIAHIIKRNSELESCAGDICPVIRKAFD